MAIIGGVEFPDNCIGKVCPFSQETFYQGNTCSRCPLFNCTGEFKLIEPEDYRHDWAVEWRRWFDSGMEGYPQLVLMPKKESE